MISTFWLMRSDAAGEARYRAVARAFLVELRVVFDGLFQLVVGFVGHVVLEHVEDEAFLDGLPH